MKKAKNSSSIGITGGIGSGKTVVSRIFKVLGIPVYDADTRAKYLLNHDGDLKSKIVDLFGPEAYKDDSLNSKWLAAQVFNDPERLEKLNRLVHPKVGEDFDQWKRKPEMRSAPYILKEAALLFEAGSFKLLDKIIVVTAPEELRMQRILRRDSHRTVDQIKDIMSRQWPDNKKLELADYVITNDDKHLIIPQVLSIHDSILKLS